MAYSTFKQVDLGIGEYARALRPAVTGVVCMCLAVWGVRTLQPVDLSRVVALTTDIATGAFVYLGTLLLLFRERLQAMTSRLRGAFS
jgi:hypothetical protein